jgi:hypothetical protein
MKPPTQNHAYLSEREIEERLLPLPELREFWSSPLPLILFRAHPKPTDPVYEIQLAWDLEDRLMTYAWIWVDAFEGKILKKIPEETENQFSEK